MSADNILIILQHDDKIRVYDVNFSDISSHQSKTDPDTTSWDFPMTAENSEDLTNYIVNESHYREIHKCNTVGEAEGFCKRYERSNLVEYGYGSIIPEDTAISILKANVKKKKAKSKSKNKPQ